MTQLATHETPSDRWTRVHIEGDRNKPIILPRLRPWRATGEGVRVSRGGFSG